MADEDPINSSDQEFPDIPIDPAILNAGQASLERMRENAIARKCFPVSPLTSIVDMVT